MHTPPISVFDTAAVVGPLHRGDDSALSSFGSVVERRFSTSRSAKFSLSSPQSGLGWSTGGCFRSTSHRHFLAGSRSDEDSSLSSSSVSVDASARRWPDGESLTDGVRQGDTGEAPTTGDDCTTDDALTSGSFSHLCSKHSTAVIRSLNSPHHENW